MTRRRPRSFRTSITMLMLGVVTLVAGGCGSPEYTKNQQSKILECASSGTAKRIDGYALGVSSASDLVDAIEDDLPKDAGKDLAEAAKGVKLSIASTDEDDAEISYVYAIGVGDTSGRDFLGKFVDSFDEVKGDAKDDIEEQDNTDVGEQDGVAWLAIVEAEKDDDREKGMDEANDFIDDENDNVVEKCVKRAE